MQKISKRVDNNPALILKIFRSYCFNGFNEIKGRVKFPYL